MVEEGQIMKFYTIKLPKFLGGIVRAMLGTFKKG
jgi:stage V sporulation protein M